MNKPQEAPRRALGKGLTALLPNRFEVMPVETPTTLPINDIDPTGLIHTGPEGPGLGHGGGGIDEGESGGLLTGLRLSELFDRVIDKIRPPRFRLPRFRFPRLRWPSPVRAGPSTGRVPTACP